MARRPNGWLFVFTNVYSVCVCSFLFFRCCNLNLLDWQSAIWIFVFFFLNTIRIYNTDNIFSKWLVRMSFIVYIHWENCILNSMITNWFFIISFFCIRMGVIRLLLFQNANIWHNQCIDGSHNVLKPRTIYDMLVLWC